MPKSRPFSRATPTRVIGRKFIIACEGEQTERSYFEGIRQSLNLSKGRITVLHRGSDPLSVVRAAAEERDTQRSTRSWTTGDEAWAVFDGDEHIAHNPGNWNDALQTAHSNGIQLAISNPCFELWYLLHFQDHRAHLTRQQARQKLRAHVADYEKASKLFPEPLAGLTTDAVARAAWLADRAQVDGLPPHSNPSTGVWELVESLRALVSG